MTKFKVYYRTILEQAIEVEVDVPEGDDGFEMAVDKAYDSVQGAPFMGWNFDASGDWEPAYARNLENGDEQEYGW